MYLAVIAFAIQPLFEVLLGKRVNVLTQVFVIAPPKKVILALRKKITKQPAIFGFLVMEILLVYETQTMFISTRAPIW